MTPITFALRKIHIAIPKRILDVAFTPDAYQRFSRDLFRADALDYQITQQIINGIVRPDCDAFGAELTDIRLDGVVPEPISADAYLLYIPKELTNNRSITSVLSLNFMSMNMMNNPVMGGYASGMMNTNCQNKIKPVSETLGKALAPMMVTETANVRLIGENTVLVEDIVRPMSGNASLRCVLTMDEDFSSLQRPAWIKFAELCVLATKAFIYNKLVLEIDQAQLVAGRNLGEFKSIVDGYSDANELYNTFLQEQWGKIQYMSDAKRMNRHIAMLVGRFK